MSVDACVELFGAGPAHCGRKDGSNVESVRVTNLRGARGRMHAGHPGNANAIGGNTIWLPRTCSPGALNWTVQSVTGRSALGRISRHVATSSKHVGRICLSSFDPIQSNLELLNAIDTSIYIDSSISNTPSQQCNITNKCNAGRCKDRTHRSDPPGGPPCQHLPLLTADTCTTPNNNTIQ